MAMNKDMKKLLTRVEAQGFEVRISTKGHVLVNKNGQRIAVTGGTPSDRRAWKNFLADLKAAGYES